LEQGIASKSFSCVVESVRPTLLHARNEMNDEENVKDVIHAIELLTEKLNT
jgi:hypothetical protein